MNKVNYLALGAVALTVISIFLPWVEVSASGGTSDLNMSFQPVIISGISIGYGIFGLLGILLGGFLSFKESKWTFLIGIVNFFDGYGYLHQWFGASTRDSANYGDVTSKSSVDPKFGIYLFILASVAFMIFTLKYYKSRKTEMVLPSEPDNKENQQPVFTTKNTVASQVYQPSKTQTMTTPSSELPTEPVPSEAPKEPVKPETVPEQPVAPQTVSEPTVETPTASAQPIETLNQPVHAVVPEPAPVYQEPRATATPQQPVVEPEKKKSSTPWVLAIILVVVLVAAGVFVMTNTSSQKSKD
ncbi:MAG: hypothetical protein Q8904_15835, partial [Bacteroidota bacterium]|nr:hypothetical protein [Bacteroidota bacterium]